MSPGLHPFDSFLRGFLKYKVYSPCTATLDQLETNIRREVAALDPLLLTKVIRSIRFRAQRCLAANGGHFES